MYTLFTILAGILWGTISLFLKPLTSGGLNQIQVLAFRCFFSSLMMAAFLFVKDRKLFRIQLKDLWMFIGTGVISLTFFSFCYFKTIIETETSVAVILLYTSPIFIFLFSIFLFKEKINLCKILALLLTFTGCILVAGLAGGGTRLTWKSLLIGLCAGLGYALYSIFSRYALKKYNPLTVTFYTFLFCFISVLPFCRVEKIAAVMNWKMWLLAAGIALVSTVLPYILYTTGLKHLETTKAAILATVEPLVGTLIGFFIWHEEITFAKTAGIVLILISVILLALPDKKTDNQNTGDEK